jgi:hypothetical protein
MGWLTCLNARLHRHHIHSLNFAVLREIQPVLREDTRSELARCSSIQRDDLDCVVTMSERNGDCESAEGDNN